jgi:hypothetical protein
MMPEGMKLINAASSKMIRKIDNKSSAYDYLSGYPVPIPTYRKAWDIEQFRKSVAEFPHKSVCYKPMRSIYGYGFRIVVEHPSSRNKSQRQLSEPKQDYDRSLPEAVRELKLNGFRPQIIMTELPGVERSVDCLAINGELVRAIIRKKLSSKKQLIEKNDAVENFVRIIAQRFCLNGLFNVQFREDSAGTNFLLEINPRMSGGIHYTFPSGINLVYWAVMIALGMASKYDIPPHITGIFVDIKSSKNSSNMSGQIS